MENNEKKMLTTADLNRTLGKKELYSVAFGHVIGSGVFSLIGIGIGYVGTMIAGKLMSDVFEGMILMPEPFIAVGAFLFSVVLGVIFGMYPAIKASGLQPVEALRAD